MQLQTPAPEAPPEKSAKKLPKPPSGTYRFLGKNRSLLAICLILAASIHLLGLLGFGTYTLFKGSVPRMPFTSQNGVSAEDVGLEAPPSEETLEMMEEPKMESEAAAIPTEISSEDEALATAGLTSALPIASAPPIMAPPPAVATTGTEKMISRPAVRAGAKASAVNFFGVKGQGTNVYFVVDVSDSMLEPERGGVPGFAAVKNNLRQMIQSLDEGTRFNIVTYGAAGADLFQATSVPATPEMKKAAETFLARYNLSTERKGTLANNYRPKISAFGLIQGDRDTGQVTTRLDLGLLAAFEGLADTIFLISDGKAPVLAEDNRAEAQEAMKEAEISDIDRKKYEKEVAAWREDYKKYTEEAKAYREKYKDLLAKRDEKIAEAKAKGEGKVREGSEFIDYGVKIPGLPPAPKEPKQPTLPQRKVAGKVVAQAGRVYDETALILRIKEVYTEVYKKGESPNPSLHTVGYMSKSAETKFLQSLAARNNGTFKSISAPIQDRSGN